MSLEQNDQSARKNETSNRGKGKNPRGGSAKLRGLPRDSEEVRMSKTLSWILRHGSKSEGLFMRPDGYVRVHELLSLPKFQGVDLDRIRKIVDADSKQRYSLISQADASTQSTSEIWWIRANQGHSMKEVELELKEITSIQDIPTQTAVHGTNRKAWEIIQNEGLSKMTRNHIHLAQGVAGSGVVSGMRQSSQILIYIDVQAALDAGIQFFISDNGVILTPGNEKGILEPRFFQRMEEKTKANKKPSGARKPKPESKPAEAASDSIEGKSSTTEVE
ncbi:hypothetical protein QCA50_008982 [Cerrena zonata]|uniref:2'-phosphotransferase n=1 Tax=Cerrena zonata TaxID=2478898 RepID=A0AAW0G349_9APHY